LSPKLPGDLFGDVVAPQSVQRVGVRHIPGGLLEVRHQPPPLEHLGQYVRDVLTGDVRSAELRHRVVAVFVEHARVQLLGARHADRFCGRSRGGHVSGELVEEQTAERLGGARITCKQRPLHCLGEVGEREYVPVGVAEIGCEPCTFLFGELFGVCRGEHGEL
jgi:hypothetical protein